MGDLNQSELESGFDDDSEPSCSSQFDQQPADTAFVEIEERREDEKNTASEDHNSTANIDKNLSPDDAIAMQAQDDPAHVTEVKTASTARNRITTLQLYRYADRFDYILITIGLLCAAIQGLTTQLPYIGVGQVITDFSDSLTNCSVGNNTSNISSCDTSSKMSDSAGSISLVFAVCGVITVLTSYTHVAVFTIVADRVARNVRRLAFSNILRQHIGYFDVHFGGELNTRLTQDVAMYEVGIGSKVSLTFAWLFTFLWGMILSMLKGWQLTLIMCVMLPIAAIVSGITGRIMKIFTEKEMTAFAKAGGVAEEALFNVKIVSAFAGQDKESSRYDRLLNEAKDVSLKSAVASSIGVGLPFLLVLSISAVTIGLSGLFVRDGKIEPGFVMQLFASMMLGLRSLGYAAGALETVSDSKGAAFGIYEIIEAKTQIDSTDPGGDTIPDVKGLIRFEGIHFVYPARANVQVLKGLTLEIQPGQTAALVGPSGCGKSTTIQLIQRFYDPDQGTVYLDGHDVKTLNLAWLRKQIGVVSQEPVLFATSIEENIRFGNPDCTLEEIMAAAKEADAHNFINKLPEKYSTALNEMGTQLSRGEKQRISLARALVRKPKILLLDECTSALDNESEAAVQAALEKASKGRTTIIIAHRLSTVRDSDVLFVVDKGVVFEYGTHDELLAKKSLYHKLVSTQMLAEKEKKLKATELETPKEVLDQIEARRLNASMRSKQSQRSTNSQKQRILNQLRATIEDEEEEEISLASHPMMRIYALNRPELAYIVVGLIGGFLIGFVWPIFSIFFSNVIDVITEPTNPELMSTVLRQVYGMLGLGVGACISAAVGVFTLRYAGEYLSMRVRSLQYKALLRQELSWFDDSKHQVGSLTSRLANEASRIKMATGNTLLYMAAAVSAIVATVVIALISGWQLGLALLPLLPLTVASGVFQGYMNTSYEVKSHSRTEESGRVASEAVDKIRTLASLSKEFYFLDKYMGYFNAMEREAKKRANIIGLSWGFHYLVGVAINIVAYGFGLYLVSEDKIEFKSIFRILLACLMTCTDVGRANANVPELTSSKAAAYKILQLLDRIPEIDPKDESGDRPTVGIRHNLNTALKMNDQVRDVVPLQVTCNGDIDLRAITYYYPTRPETLVLNNFNVSAKRGQSIAIVGPSGGGKSTVAQLIERFYDVFSGVVMIDGKDVKELNIGWLRSQMGIVTQEPILFALTLAENIAYGDNSRDVSREEVIDAAKNANIHAFIETLPLGYDTNIGSKGTQLSGGQKQRISIARALVRNPKILLLDDATSALDSHSESIVEEALNKARAGRTSIVISHRLSSIVGADMILYMDRGRVLEKGTHGELMVRKKHYYALQQANQGHK